MPRTWLFALIFVSFSAGQALPDQGLKTLYESQQWADLEHALGTARGHQFYRGAVGVVFHQDPKQAEALLRATIRRSPKSDEAYQAYEWLTHLFFYSGQYARAIQAMEQRWAAFPEKPAIAEEQNAVAHLRGLPNQQTVRMKASSLRHDEGSIFVPLSVHGKPVSFFFDTGAWVSSTSESEAKRLGLRFTGGIGSAVTMTNRTGFRTAVAKRLSVGGIRLENVSFLVFPDEGEPWSLLPPGRRGMLGIPVILAFRTLRWEPGGAFDVGRKAQPFDVSQSNLRFDNDHLALVARIEGHDVMAAVDTGAESTDFYREFGTRFPALLASGTKGTTEVRGVGGAESYESITLPALQVEIGGRQTVLRNAGVLMSRGMRSYVGNFGMDLFKQGAAFKLDFAAMRLELEQPLTK